MNQPNLSFLQATLLAYTKINVILHLAIVYLSRYLIGYSAHSKVNQRKRFGAITLILVFVLTLFNIIPVEAQQVQDRINDIQKTGAVQLNKALLHNETIPKKDKTNYNVVTALPRLLADIDSENIILKKVTKAHNLSQTKLIQQPNETILSRNLLYSNSVMALPRLPEGSESSRKSNESVVMLNNSERPDFFENHKSTKTAIKIELRKDGTVSAVPEPLSLQTKISQGEQFIKISKDNYSTTSINSQNRVANIQEANSINNYAPIATPDVYTTPKNTELVVTAPGHLANDSDPDGDPLQWNSYTVPSNGTMSNTDPNGQFTYTPDPGFSGIESFQVAISDDHGNITFGLITILVIPDQNSAPLAVPDVFITQENTALVVPAPGHLANDSDLDGDPIQWNSYTVPSNGTMSNTDPNGQFTYTPDPGFSGIESFQIAISDDNGNIAFGLITILVVPDQNRAPVAIPDAYSTPEGTPLIVSAPGHLSNDFDLDGDPIQWNSYTVPSNGTMSNTDPNGQFTYTPNPGFSGIESFQMAISDDHGNINFGLITITVTPAGGDAPVAVADVYTTPENTALVIPAPGHLANDFDPNGDPITWNSYTVPSNGTMSNTDPNGQFTYTPDPGFSGIESFQIAISDDNGNIDFGLITILVIPDQNRAPVAVPDVYTTPEDTPLIVSAPGHLGNDIDEDGDPIQWNSYTVPSNGIMSNTDPNGQFTYTPNPGFSGIESFQIAISDDHGNIDFGLITIFVVPDQNRPPVSVPDVYTTPESIPLIVSAPGHLSNDFDLDGDPIQWNSYTVPSNGSMSGTDPNGQFTYTPDPGFSGIESFQIAISDDHGNIDFGLITIAVTKNNPPIANAGDDQIVIMGQSVVLNGNGSSDPDGNALTYNWIFATEDASNPIPSGSGATLNGATTATPSFEADLPGIYSVKLIVNDGLADSDPDYVTITALSFIEVLDNLIADVEALLADGTLNMGQANALTKKIKQTQNLLNKDKTYEALDVLADLRQQVLDLYEEDDVLNESQAIALFSKIDQLSAAISGYPSLDMYKLALKVSAPLKEETLASDKFSLSSIYPNPFRTAAEITFSIPVASRVNIVVYDMLSNRVAVLKEGRAESGYHRVTLNGDALKSGTYIVQMTTDEGFQDTKRVVLLH